MLGAVLATSICILEVGRKIGGPVFRIFVRSLFMLLVFMLGLPQAYGEDTVLIRLSDGGYQAGAVQSFSIKGKELVFVISDEFDAKSTFQVLQDQYDKSEFYLRQKGNTWTIGGVRISDLLKRLVNLEMIRAGEDPLTMLSRLGFGAAANTGPESGGSIRVGKTVSFAKLARPREQDLSRATVRSVRRGAFPYVALELELNGLSLSLAPKFKGKKVGTFRVSFPGPGLNNSPKTRQNLVANYLLAGDSVEVLLVWREKDWMIDWLARVSNL